MNTRRLPLLALLASLAAPCFAQEPFRTPPDRPVDIEKIALDLSVDLEKKTVEGYATVTFTALREGVTVVRLDAVDHQLATVGVRTSKVQGPAGYDYDGSVLSVRMPAPLARGERATVEVRYTLLDPSSGLHFFGPTEDDPDVPYQVWSQGESITNRYWFPCVDHPDERQATSLTARVKPGLTVISNGKLTAKEEDKETGLVAWHYVQEQEHVAYLVSLVVGTFETVEGKWRDKPLAYHVPPGHKDDIPRSFARTGEMLDLYSKLTGVDYPWPKYDQVVVEQFSAGGMENTGATTLNMRTLHDERAHLDYSSEGLVAHEAVHQWYGDLLTCRDWAHIWLNESFATFFGALWTEHARGADAYGYEILGNSERGMRAGKTRPIVDRRWSSPGSMFDGRAYPKGSCVLHMLRRQLGEDAFWRGIRRYTKENSNKSVETSDLRRALEAESGRNLERFFYDWTGRPGNPVLEVDLSHDTERGLTTVRIKQTQQGEAYAFPAELEFQFGERKEIRSFDVVDKNERFTFTHADAPTGFRFDPREAVLLKEVTVKKGRELWVRQLRDADVIGRIRAARALGKNGRPEWVASVTKALAEDSFWGVRAECAVVLASVDTDAARDALLAALKQEHPKVRRAVVKALGQRGRDERAAGALLKILMEGDPSYYVESEAVEAYSRTAATPRPLLDAQLEKDSHNETIRLAAIRSLRRLEDPSIIPLLVARLKHPNHRRVRREAARALAVAGFAGVSEKHRLQAVEALKEFARTANGRGKRSALEALKDLGARAREALPVAEALAKKAPNDRIRKLAQEVVDRIYAGAPPDHQLARIRGEANALEKKVEALEEAKQDLEARVERLERLLLEKEKKGK